MLWNISVGEILEDLKKNLANVSKYGLSESLLCYFYSTFMKGSGNCRNGKMKLTSNTPPPKKTKALAKTSDLEFHIGRLGQ